MADFTLANPAKFPEGTSVGAYPEANWPTPGEPSGAPLGEATDTQEVSGGAVTFTGLVLGTTYWAVGEVGGSYRYVKIVAATDSPVGEAGGALAGEYPNPTLALPLNLTGVEAATDLLTARVTGDEFPRFVINADGKMEFGSGAGALDTDLFRVGVNSLGTTDELRVSLDIYVRLAGAAQIFLGVAGPSSEAGIVFGSAGDTGVYRAAAGIFAISDAAQLTEMAEAPAGLANTGRFFVEDNGSGKTRAMIQFGTGAAQQIAIEP